MTHAAPDRLSPLALLVLSAGCAAPGTIRLDGVDGFDEVGSAAWLVEEGDTSTTHRLLLSSDDGACEAWQEAATRMAALTAGPRDDCETFQAKIADIGDLLDGVVGAGAASVELSLSGAPAEGGWATPDPDGADVGPTFTGRLRLWKENPYTWAATSYECGDPDPLSEYVSELLDDLALEPASLDLASVAARSVEGELSASVSADADGDLREEGSLEAQARFTRCELDPYEDPVLDVD